MKTLDKQAYFAFINKWFKIYPESIVSFEKDEVEEEVVSKAEEKITRP